MLKSLDYWKARFESGSKNKPPFPKGEEKKRYLALLNGFEKHFGSTNTAVFSSPGRVELSGNHTDHQGGQVLAAAVNLDMIAVAAPRDTGTVRIFSKGYGYEEIELSELSPRPEEKGSSPALVRGMAAALKSRGFSPGGFDAYISSKVPLGSGLSSSAAFEMLIGKIFSVLFCGDGISPKDLALMGQFAENRYFGKPSGLMDQLACSVGGVLYIDFKNPESPLIKALNCPFDEKAYSLFITNAGGNHSDLTHEYAAITREMLAVAAFFGKGKLREVNEDEFYRNLPLLREKLSHRALLRAMHFFDENSRVARQFEALSRGNMQEYLALMDESGRSSQELLQNIYPIDDINERSLSLALAVSRRLLGKKGAVRVHGGGFAGTVMAFVPREISADYKNEMDRIFGKGACLELSFRQKGAMVLK